MADLNVVTKCKTLQNYWNKRNVKFKDWYSLIEMIDTLAQENMESFVGNDPRAIYGLVLSMLDQKIPHRIPPELINMEQVVPAAELSSLFSVAWDDVYQRYRKRGRYFLRDLIGFLLVTGWYSVFATVSTDGSRCIAEVWHPATVFPSWDDELIECAHIFRISGLSLKRMAARNGWEVKRVLNINTIYDYWWLDTDEVTGKNRVWNSVAVNNNTGVVKPPTHEAKFKRIPIFTSPVGGLPDTGELAISDTDRWKGETGQSIVAANENIYNYWNKWWTFSMQLLRDTAQARTYEKSRSGKAIVKPEDWYKRGAHFRLGPDDEIGFLTPPAIPVELRSAQLDMEAMMQRGGPSWAMFGNIQQQMTAYMMSQISASANQASKSFHQGVVDCVSDIDNFWYDLIKENKYKPYGLGIPAKLPSDFRISADYEIRIPGDLAQRATVARMLNPAFELSEEKIMGDLFPEIKNPIEELAKVRANRARRHPIHAAITLIESFREEARLLREVKDVKGAELYEKAANLVEASMTAQPDIEEERAAPKPRPEVVPPPATEPVVERRRTR